MEVNSYRISAGGNKPNEKRCFEVISWELKKYLSVKSFYTYTELPFSMAA